MSAACRPLSSFRMRPSASRTGSGHVTPRAVEVFHQPEKERQILGIDALFVERQDEGAFRRMHEIIRVLDAFGNSLERQQVAEPIAAR